MAKVSRPKQGYAFLQDRYYLQIKSHYTFHAVPNDVENYLDNDFFFFFLLNYFSD